MHNILKLLSKLLLPDSWEEDGDSQLLDLAHSQLTKELERLGAVEIFVSSDGTLTIGGESMPPAEKGPCLGQILSNVGVRKLALNYGLEPVQLAQFIQTISMIGADPAGLESDLVTFWREEGERTIRFTETSLTAKHLCPDKRSGQVRELAVVATALGIDESHGSSAEALVERCPEITPPQPSRLDDEDHEIIEMLVGTMASETEAGLRHQFSASLMASMGSHEPAMGQQEYGFLLAKVVGEQMMYGEWGEIQRTLRNLEFLVDSCRGGISQHTYASAVTSLDMLHGPRTLLRLVDAIGDSDIPEPPFKVVRWFIGEESPAVWSKIVEKLDEDQVEALVTLFSICYAFEHPFWEEAVERTPAKFREEVSSTVERLKSQWAESGFGLVQEPSDDDSGMDWDLVDFDDIGDGFPDQLDEDVLAFLDESSPGEKIAGSPSSPAQGEPVPAVMLEQLDALERSLLQIASSGIGKRK